MYSFVYANKLYDKYHALKVKTLGNIEGYYYETKGFFLLPTYVLCTVQHSTLVLLPNSMP